MKTRFFIFLNRIIFFHISPKSFLFNFLFVQLRGCSYEGELARLGGLALLGEMIFIPCLYGIFFLISIKKFVCSWKKIV